MTGSKVPGMNPPLVSSVQHVQISNRAINQGTQHSCELSCSALRMLSSVLSTKRTSIQGTQLMQQQLIHMVV